eukprot:5275888-Pleurochrysis_carterae.AAC.2
MLLPCCNILRMHSVKQHGSARRWLTPREEIGFNESLVARGGVTQLGHHRPSFLGHGAQVARPGRHEGGERAVEGREVGRGVRRGQC